jgi:hypothetical protein
MIYSVTLQVANLSYQSKASRVSALGGKQFVFYLNSFRGEDVMKLEKKHKVLGVAAMTALAASLFLVPVALAQPPYFDDVPPGHMFYDQINWIYENGITSGCSVTPPLYCPDAAVSRGQMAVFMYRLAGNGTGGAIVDADTLDGLDSTDFSDAVHNHWGESWSGSGDGLTLTSSDQHAIVGNSSGVGYSGVVGVSDAYVGVWAWPPPAGVFGQVTDPASNAPAVAGMAPYIGVAGNATEGGSGIVGQSMNGDGVVGYGMYKGVSGETDYEYGKAVYGYASSLTGFTYGVYGEVESPDGAAGYFENLSDSSGFGASILTMNLPDSNMAILSYTKTQTGPGEWDLDEIFSVSTTGYLTTNTVQAWNDDPSGFHYGVTGAVQAAGGSRGVSGTSGAGSGEAYGVYGRASSPDGYGGFFINTGSGNLLAANDQQNTSDLEFRVDSVGNVYADGTFNPGGADFAEMLPGVEGLEAGDVLVIRHDGQLTRSTQSCQADVVGVYSTRPGFVGGASDDGDLKGQVPLAVVGVVPVKASTENGAIRPGDLLVSATIPGHAMKAGDSPVVGTVIGKALESLEYQTGLILILVMLQ